MSNVLLGVTGGIAAYRACDLTRDLQRRGHSVRVVMTKSAEAFVSALTFETLSGHPVTTSMFERASGDLDSWSVEHVGFAQWADLLLVAPATANTLGKFARGLADDFLSTFYLAWEGPTLAAPAMNRAMWNHPAVKDNVALLRKRGVFFVGPDTGMLACGDEGIGKLSPNVEIFSEAVRLLNLKSLWAGKSVLVSAGPTFEPLDRVRGLSSRSSGKMGYALAREAHLRGANVILVSGPTALEAPTGVNCIRVSSGAEMEKELLRHFPKTHAFFMSAAVSDFRPKNSSAKKIKKDKLSKTITLSSTRDILKTLAAKKGNKLILGFAAEESSVMEKEALRKLKSKKLTAIFANPVSKKGVGFEGDDNEGILFDKKGGRTVFSKSPKTELAGKLLDALEHLL